MASEKGEVAPAAEAELTTGDEVNAGMARALGIPVKDDPAATKTEQATETPPATDEEAEPKADTEDEAAEESEESGEDAAESDEDAEEKDDQAGESPEAHGWQKRVDRLTAQKKELQEKLEALEAKAKELEAKTAATTVADPELFRNVGIPPDYVTAEEAQTIQTDRELAAAERWLVDNADGFEGTVDGKPVTMTPKQVQQRLFAIREQRDDVRLEARAIQKRVQAEIAADLKAAREARQKAKTQPAETPQATKKPLPKPPPKVVPTGTVPARTVTERKRAGVGDVFENHKKAGRSEQDAAIAALASFG